MIKKVEVFNSLKSKKERRSDTKRQKSDKKRMKQMIDDKVQSELLENINTENISSSVTVETENPTWYWLPVFKPREIDWCIEGYNT